MGKPYSLDLRERICAYVSRGHSARSAGRVFGVSAASQSYLRAGVGVILGLVFLGETFSLPVVAGLGAAIGGVTLINWPVRQKIKS